MKVIIGFTVFLMSVFVGVTYCRKADSSACTRCQKGNSCKPPDCFCCRDELNLPMSIKDVPQIVFFTFDDALTARAADFYNQLFNVTGRKNPNGCPLSMTMFISHQDTKYNKVSEFYQKGMEIAAHSVTHKHMTPENFLQEAKTQKQNLAKLGGVPENEIVGWRSPFLEPIGDLQPDKLKELGYVYDATLTFSKRNLYDKSPTPFTLDFGWPYDCKVKPCPHRRHYGFWEVPVVSLLDYKHKYDCVYVDGCNNPPPDESSAYKFLMDNFNSYYTRSRVPFGINMHPSWFYTPHRLSAMDRFIQTLMKMDDVYIVSVDKMIKWLKNPTPLSRLQNFEPWSCPSVKAHSHIGESSTHTTKGRNVFNFKSSIFNHHRHYRNGRPAPMTKEEIQRRHIQARLRQIAQMRVQINIDREKQLNQMKHHDEAREKWWSRSNIHRVPKKLKIHSNGHQDPFTNKVNTHINHTRKITTTESTRPRFQFANSIKKEKNIVKQAPLTATKIPFWKNKNIKPSRRPVPAFKSASPWWDKPVPKINNVRKTRYNTSPTSRPVKQVQETTPKPIANLAQQKSKVDFAQQLRDQQNQQKRIIEEQKKRQREQLHQMQMELRKNQRISIEKQQEEERKRIEAELREASRYTQPLQKKVESSSMIQPNAPVTKSRIEQTFDPWQQFVKQLMGQRNRT